MAPSAPSAPSAPPSKDADFRRAAFEEAQQLTSVEELRQAVELAGDEILSKLLKQSVYVGPVNHECLGFCRMIEDQTFPDVFLFVKVMTVYKSRSLKGVRFFFLISHPYLDF